MAALILWHDRGSDTKSLWPCACKPKPSFTAGARIGLLREYSSFGADDHGRTEPERGRALGGAAGCCARAASVLLVARPRGGLPDLSDKVVYGDYRIAGERGYQLLETVTAEINACNHIKSGSWPCKKIGADVGREDEAAFEAYAPALEQTRPEAASGSAPLMQRPAEEAADMAVDASPAPLGERPATAHRDNRRPL